MLGYTMVNAIGNVGRDPETKFVGVDKSVTSFSLAVNETWNNANGEKQERTNWFDCEAWGKSGETIVRFVKKGHPLFVTGRLRHEVWEKDDGTKGSKVKILVDGFRLLKGRDNSGDTDNPPASVTQAKPTAKPKAPNPGPVSEDDIPF